jgi:hypothetical protein
MVTAERSETQQTTTVPRYWLLTVQVRNLLSRTTDIGESTLEKIDKASATSGSKPLGCTGWMATSAAT